MDQQERVSAARALTDEQLASTLFRGHTGSCRHVWSEGRNTCDCGWVEAQREHNRRHAAMIAETTRSPQP